MGNINFDQPWTSDGRPESENKNYNVGESVIVAWDVTLDNAFVTLNQVGEPGETGGPFVILRGNVSGTTWSWTVTYAGMDPDNAYRHMYYFSMEDKDNYGTGVYFNISDAAVTSTLASAATSTALATTTTSTSAIATASPSGASTPTSIAHRVSTGTLAGIVVGSVVATLAIAGLLYWCWRWRAARNRGPRAAERDGNEQSGASGAITGSFWTPAHELPGSLPKRLVEVDGGYRPVPGCDGLGSTLRNFELDGADQRPYEMEGAGLRAPPVELPASRR